KNFVKYIMGTKTTFMFTFTIFNFIVVFVLWSLIIIKQYKKSIEQKRIKSLFFFLLLGLGGYLLLLLTLYMTKFGEYESVRLASFERYAGTYLAAILLILVVFTLKFLLNKNNTKFILFATLCFISFFNIDPVLSITG